MKDHFLDPSMREPFAQFNASIQTGYFILSVRAAGLAAGPLAGFDAKGIDAEFFAGTPLHSVLVVNIGTPTDDAWFDRLPRLDYDEVVTAI
jgi:3-hydroxypropanoate dehydrogenase